MNESKCELWFCDGCGKPYTPFAGAAYGMKYEVSPCCMSGMSLKTETKGSNIMNESTTPRTEKSLSVFKEKISRFGATDDDIVQAVDCLVQDMALFETELNEAKAQLEAALKDVEHFKANNRYQRGYGDGEKDARSTIKDLHSQLATLNVDHNEWMGLAKDLQIVVENCKADKERMDWLEHDGCLKTIWCRSISLKDFDKNLWNVRQAIDSAMKKERE